jgi:hypothetical protein
MGLLVWSLSARAAAQFGPIAQKYSTCERLSSELRRAWVEVGSSVPSAAQKLSQRPCFRDNAVSNSIRESLG